MNQDSSPNTEVQIESLGRSSYRLTTEVTLPRPRAEVFQFFADAANLEKITPDFLNFRILTPLPIEMKTDARIEYKIRLRGIPIKWRTNILPGSPTSDSWTNKFGAPTASGTTNICSRILAIKR